MIRGLYTAGWSMLACNKKMDVLANNLANVNTNGFKRDNVVYQSFPELLTKKINYEGDPTSSSTNIGSMSLGNDIGEVHTYFQQGALEQTQKTLDLAIKDGDNAFFAVARPDSQGNFRQYYTRDGSFSLDEQGRLVTKDGNFVMGENGVIQLNSDRFSVEADGTVIESDAVVGRILIKQFENPETLKKIGDNLLAMTQETEEQDFSGEIVQGFIEQSNVNTIREMVEMITVVRAYETNQKMVQIQDSTLEKAVNEVGRT